jgi:hypothetical protein
MPHRDHARKRAMRSEGRRPAPAFVQRATANVALGLARLSRARWVRQPADTQLRPSLQARATLSAPKLPSTKPAPK